MIKMPIILAGIEKMKVNILCPDCSVKAEKTEKFYICQNCGDLTTWTEQQFELEGGGQGLCECGFMVYEWSEKFQDLEPWYPRIYSEWTIISKRWYERLKGERNAVLRLKMFNEIPKDKLMLK